MNEHKKLFKQPPGDCYKRISQYTHKTQSPKKLYDSLQLTGFCKASVYLFAMTKDIRIISNHLGDDSFTRKSDFALG